MQIFLIGILHTFSTQVEKQDIQVFCDRENGILGTVISHEYVIIPVLSTHKYLHFLYPITEY